MLNVCTLFIKCLVLLPWIRITLNYAIVFQIIFRISFAFLQHLFFSFSWGLPAPFLDFPYYFFSSETILQSIHFPSLSVKNVFEARFETGWFGFMLFLTGRMLLHTGILQNSLPYLLDDVSLRLTISYWYMHDLYVPFSYFGPAKPKSSVCGNIDLAGENLLLASPYSRS